MSHEAPGVRRPPSIESDEEAQSVLRVMSMVDTSGWEARSWHQTSGYWLPERRRSGHPERVPNGDC